MKSYDFNSIFLNQLNKILFKFNYKINYDYKFDKISKIDLFEKKIKLEKNKKNRYQLSKDFIKQFPDNPKSHLALTVSLFKNFDLSWIEQSHKYAKVRNDWIENNQLADFEYEFIGAENIIGSLGNHAAIEGLINANKYQLRSKKKINLFLSKKDAKPRNKTLFKYFEPHLNILNNQKAFSSYREFESHLRLPMGFLLPSYNKSIFYDFLPSLIKKKQYDESGYQPLFKLSNEDKEKGKLALKEIGVKEDDWYVTIHIREPGYRGETKKNSLENFRNSNPLNYTSAIKYITDQGGWVFRMGDNSMTKLPRMRKVIDYCHSDIKSDFLDVYLAATSRFCIGTPSGYYTLADFFGVPILLTNLAWLSPYYTLGKKDLFTPRVIKKNNEILSLDTMLQNPYIFLNSDNEYKNYNVETVENSSEDILNGTIEMLEKTSEKPKVETSNLQDKFRDLAEKKIYNLTKEQFYSHGNISSAFLEKNNKYLF